MLTRLVAAPPLPLAAGEVFKCALVLICVPLMWQALLAVARWRNGKLVALARAPTRIPGIVEEGEEVEEEDGDDEEGTPGKGAGRGGSASSSEAGSAAELAEGRGAGVAVNWN
jgi:hypothetical protein